MAKKSKSKTRNDDILISSAPDGGYAWAIMFASFAMHIIVDGIQFSFGIFFVEFLEYFQMGKGKTSLVGSALAGLTQMTAPLASSLVTRFGCRPVAIAGSIIATFGFAACRAATTINGLTVSYGIIGGLGLGLMYLPAVVSVSIYFEKRRAFATGVAVCGAGVGCFIFAPAGSYMLSVLDWKNAMLIVAAITAQGCIFGALFRPLPLPKLTIQNVVNNNDVADDDKCPSRSTAAVATTYDEVCELQEVEMLKTEFARATDDVAEVQSTDDGTNVDATKNGTSHAETEKGPRKKSGMCRRVEAVFRSFGFHLLKEPIFIIPFLTNTFASFGLFVPFVFITDTAISRGIEPSKAAFLLSVIGITNTLGRVLMGLIADSKYVSALLLHNLSLLMAGVTCIFIMFCWNYATLVIFALVFGLCIATWLTLTSIVLCDLLGIQKLANSFGLLCLVRGAAAMVGSPIAGFVYDVTGDYDLSFLFAGLMFLVSGAVCCLLHLPVFQRQKFSRAIRR